MPTQKEMIETILHQQEVQGKLLHEIDDSLRGPDYDPQDGGLIAEVHQNTRCIKDIKKKQNKIIGWGVTIFGAINIAGIIFTIIKSFGG